MSSNSILGSEIIDALGRSNEFTILDPDANASSTFTPVLATLGIRNYAQYTKGAASVSLEVGVDGILSITPMRNGGSREGFVEVAEKSRSVGTLDAAQIAIAVKECFDEHC